ncbi:DUF551 domain-containing protein [Cronobacter sakazakii]|uniref:DUF551 domain-containing protein n=1 Tax=Cronobacter sakazakii TaxID=28141 RepID=UPI0029E52EC4|nr:DUF551 domain-containing protein [Cronobacter sakazakii]EIZ2458703.1 DUF551 domain-containing protein [Cronobacter sakazakii]EJK7928849.1 DUF551 domain-containing protein [Cronobacter sakazakii]ELY4040062.1 DUF551 domain-containing protein [Cronobacter sakazakii]ELY4141597.1 DUF551 domain-containing protein [Cronobacter sakazakii]
MSEISKAALAEACEEKVRQLEFSVKQSAFDSVRQELETELAIARVALLALRERAEPVAWRHDDGPFASGALTRSKSVAESWIGNGWKVTPLYTAPPAPVAAGWIACSERMPELNTRVLLYFPDYGGHIEDGCIGDEGDGHYHYFFDGDSLRHEPTHWMPLPEAPAKN